MKILITGFEPFGEYPLNPSQLLVHKLPDQRSHYTLVKDILPVHHALAPQKLITLLNEHQPDAVIAFGLASSRAMISLERVAINLLDYVIPDNAGVTFTNQAVVKDGPAAYFSTLPLEHLLTALKDAGIPAETSLSAGAYLCNQIFYHIMHKLATENLTIPAGFIHLPALPEQAARSQKPMSSMPFDSLLTAGDIILETVAKTAFNQS